MTGKQQFFVFSLQERVFEGKSTFAVCTSTEPRDPTALHNHNHNGQNPVEKSPFNCIQFCSALRLNIPKFNPKIPLDFIKIHHSHLFSFFSPPNHLKQNPCETVFSRLRNINAKRRGCCGSAPHGPDRTTTVKFDSSQYVWVSVGYVATDKRLGINHTVNNKQ